MPTPLAIVHADDNPTERCRSCFWYDAIAAMCHLNPGGTAVVPSYFCSHHATLGDRDRIVRTFE